MEISIETWRVTLRRSRVHRGDFQWSSASDVDRFFAVDFPHTLHSAFRKNLLLMSQNRCCETHSPLQPPVTDIKIISRRRWSGRPPGNRPAMVSIAGSDDGPASQRYDPKQTVDRSHTPAGYKDRSYQASHSSSFASTSLTTFGFALPLESFIT